MTYAERHAALVLYLRAKVEEADWHAVGDAATDLRVLEARGPVDPGPCGYVSSTGSFGSGHSLVGCCLSAGHQGPHQFGPPGSAVII